MIDILWLAQLKFIKHLGRGKSYEMKALQIGILTDSSLKFDSHVKMICVTTFQKVTVIPRMSYQFKR